MCENSLTTIGTQILSGLSFEWTMRWKSSWVLGGKRTSSSSMNSRDLFSSSASRAAVVRSRQRKQNMYRRAWAVE